MGYLFQIRTYISVLCTVILLMAFNRIAKTFIYPSLLTFATYFQALKPPGDDNSYYTDNITRSATLPNNYGRQLHNGDLTHNDSQKNATLQARLLPAYKQPEQGGIIGNIQNRQRIMSTPEYQRNRTNSQSSSYSSRYHSTNRVVTTHIPAHIDKRLVRSRSVGVIPDAELKMRKTASASVVKIDDCEDWIV